MLDTVEEKKNVEQILEDENNGKVRNRLTQAFSASLLLQGFTE